MTTTTCTRTHVALIILLGFTACAQQVAPIAVGINKPSVLLELRHSEMWSHVDVAPMLPSSVE